MNSSHLPQQLRINEAFWFPVSTSQARKDIFVGGLLFMFLLIIGWILNLGNRLNVVGRFYRNEQPVFRGFSPFGYTFRRGCISFLAISLYLTPSAVFACFALFLKFNDFEKLHFVAAFLSAIGFILGVFALPGGMTVYACENDLSVLKNPRLSFLRAWRKRRIYSHAWFISLVSVFISLFGILALGIGFFFSSVWAWEVTGYAFTVAMYSEEEGI
jgi:hypothetical protein